MSENAKQTDPDIVKMDFPPYVEEQSPFPDVEPEFNFEDNKEEIYRRNRIIAAKEQVRLLKEENRKKLEKQEQFREMTEAAKAANKAANTANKKSYWDKLVLPVSIITACGIISSIVALSGRTSKPSVSVSDLIEEMETDNIWAEMRLTETAMAVPQTEAATQVSAEPIVTEISEEITEEEETEIILEKDPFSVYDEIHDEILKTTAVREPFEAAEGETVVNTTAMSYKIKNASSHRESERGRYDTIRGSASVTAEITIKNLTDYDYAVNMRCFKVSARTHELNDNGVKEFSDYDENLAEYSERGDLLWLHFDENNLCSFTVTVSNYSWGKDHLEIKYDFVEGDTQSYDKARKNSILEIYKYEVDREGINVKIEIPEDNREWVIAE